LSLFSGGPDFFLLSLVLALWRGSFGVPKLDPIRLLARAQTLTVLDRCDAGRKKDLLLFLFGASLISPEIPKDDAILKLFGADLSRAALGGAYLPEAHLRGAVLLAADLSDATLRCPNLSGADLRGANLTDAKGWTERQWKKAKSLRGATMPNGQPYGRMAPR
jgi:hypothetical protein